MLLLNVRYIEISANLHHYHLLHFKDHFPRSLPPLSMEKNDGTETAQVTTFRGTLASSP